MPMIECVEYKNKFVIHFFDKYFNKSIVKTTILNQIVVFKTKILRQTFINCPQKSKRN